MNRKYVITVSYGDYTKGAGGTDKVILSHQKIYNENNIDVIHLLKNKRFSSFNIWTVLLNGETIGEYSNKRLMYLIYRLHKENSDLCEIVIHHLKNVDIGLLTELLEYCEVPLKFYLHDYYTICPKSGLIKDDGTFCNNGFPECSKCKNCKSYSESIQQIDKTRDFLRKFEDRITFIAPSDVAKEVWVRDYPQYTDKVKVIFHQNLIGEYHGNNEIISNDEPLRIGFIGYQRPLKGWSEYKNAVQEAHSLNLNEKFFQFGWGEDRLSYISQIELDFKKSMTAMTDELRNKKIHVAIIWSKWPETYAYTYYESMAANCFVITNDQSGNICAQVKSRKNGIVSSDLSEMLCNEDNLRELVNRYRTERNFVPESLVENDAFISLLSEPNWKAKKVKFCFDKSFVIMYLKKFKKIISIKK